MSGWLIPLQEEAWFEVRAGEPSEVHLWIGNEPYFWAAPFISQADAEAFMRWCIVDDRQPIRTTRRKLPGVWPQQPRAWLRPETAIWELFVERGAIRGRWWWLLLVADHQTTAVAGTFRSRDEALGFHAWLRQEGAQIHVERVEPVRYSFEEQRTWLTEMEKDLDRERMSQRVDFEEALAETEHPKRPQQDLYELMRRHEARDRSAGENGA